MGFLKKLTGGISALGKSSSESKQTPWGPQAKQLERGFGQASDWLDKSQGPNYNQQEGWASQLDSAQNGLGGALLTATTSNAFFSNPNLLNPGSNQYLQGGIDNLGENISRQSDRNQNTINQQAAQAGAYGGGRQGVAQGLNAEAATNAFADGSSRMLMDNYNNRMQQMQQQQQFLPQLAQMSQMPGMIQEQIGSREQNLEMDNLSRFWNIVGSNNWGGKTTNTKQASPLEMFGQFTQGMKNLGGAMPTPTG